MMDGLAGGERTSAAVTRRGERTGQLQAALATPSADPAFGAEPITPADVAGWAEGVRRQIAAARDAARERVLPDVPDGGGPARLGALVRRVKTPHHRDFPPGQTPAGPHGPG